MSKVPFSLFMPPKDSWIKIGSKKYIFKGFVSRKDRRIHLVRYEQAYEKPYRRRPVNILREYGEDLSWSSCEPMLLTSYHRVQRKG